MTATKRRAPVHFIDTFSALRRRLGSVAEEAYAPLGIGPTHAKLLRTLGEHQPMSQAELARATRTDPALTGRLLVVLQDLGWVRRRRSREDRRAFSLELTPEGEEILTQVKKAREALSRRIEACLDAGDLDAFDRLVRKLLDTFPG